MSARHLENGGGTRFTGAMVFSITRVVGQDVYFCSPRCKIWYQRVVETSTTESRQRSTIEAAVIMQDNMSAAPHSQKRKCNHEEEFDEVPANFRRVRLRYSDQTQEPGSSQAAQETDISPNGNSKSSWNKAASTQVESVEIPVQMTGVIASTLPDSASAFYTDAERTVPDVAASISASESLAAEDQVSLTYSSASEEELRHPIGGSYIHNAQLVYGSDGEINTLTTRNLHWYDPSNLAWLSHVPSQPVEEESEYNRKRQTMSLVLEEWRLRNAFEKQGF